MTSRKRRSTAVVLATACIVAVTGCRAYQSRGILSLEQNEEVRLTFTGAVVVSHRDVPFWNTPVTGVGGRVMEITPESIWVAPREYQREPGKWQAVARGDRRATIAFSRDELRTAEVSEMTGAGLGMATISVVVVSLALIVGVAAIAIGAAN